MQRDAVASLSELLRLEFVQERDRWPVEIFHVQVPELDRAPQGQGGPVVGAAVRLAAIHVKEQAGADGRFFVGGYSNGAALSVEYALDSLQDPDLPPPDGLFLFSPALGVSKLAVLAKWQMALSKIPFLEKLGWLDILPEYDPFKYNSFPTNAGLQIYRLTSTLAQKMDAARDSGQLEKFPPVLSFASVVDATVPIRAVIDRLYDKLPANGSELVLFDVNRESDMQRFIKTTFDQNLKLFLNAMI